MIRATYKIPKIGDGTEENPYEPEWKPEYPEEWFKVRKIEDEYMVVEVYSREKLEYPVT